MQKSSNPLYRRFRSSSLRLAVLAGAVCCAAAIPHAHADTWTWNGGGATVGNFNWSDTANWTHTSGSSSSGTPLSSTDTIISFAGTLGPVPNQDIANPLLLNSLNFQSSASAFQLSGNALDFATSSASVLPTIVQNSAAGDVIINSITLNNNTTLSGSGTGGIVFLGNITGSSSLSITGGGNMALLGTNTYAGGTTINGGTVVIGSSSSLGTGNLTFTSGNLIAGNVTLTSNFTTNGAAAMGFQANAGTTFIINPHTALFGSMNFGSSTNTGTVNFEPGTFSWFGGTINVNGGTLLDGADALAQTLTAYTVNIASGATFNLNGFGTTINNLTGSGNLATGTNGSQTLTLSTANFSGIISGSDTLVTTGNTVILSGPNTYIGGTILQGGNIGVGNNSALGTQSAAVTANTTMNAVGSAITLSTAITINSSNLTIVNSSSGAQSLTLSGNITSNGGLIMNGTGSLKLSGNNSYTGNTTLNSGELIINNNNSIGTGTLIFNGGALTASANATLTNYTTGSATAGVTFRADAATTLTLGGGTENFFASTLNFGSPGFTGTVIVAPGAAYLTSGANLNVNSGTLRDGDGILATFLASDIVTVAVAAKLDLNNHSTSISSLLGGGNITTGTSASQQLTLITANFSGIISGSGQLLTASNSTTVILSNANTYTGNTTLAGGTLGLGNNAALSTGNISLTGNTSLYAAAADHTLANNISLASTTALTITNDLSAAHNLTLSGNLTGSGGLVMNGSASLTLSGNNSYSGNTTLNSGELIINNNNSIGTGTLIFNGGALTASANATLTNYTTGSATAGVTFRADAATNLTLGGGTENLVASTLNFGSPGFTGTVIIAPASAVFYVNANLNVNAGTLRDGDGILATFLANDIVTVAVAAKLDLNNFGASISSLLGGGNITTGSDPSQQLTLITANFSGIISGSDQLLTASNSTTVILSGANTYTGPTTLAGGTVGFGNNSALSTGNITVSAPTSLYAMNADHTLSNAVTVNAGLTIQDDPSGAHNLTFAGPVTGSGAIGVSGNGTLTFSASLNLNTLIIGTITPLAPSKVVFSGGNSTVNKLSTLTFNSTSTLDLTATRLIIEDTSASRATDITTLKSEIASSKIFSSNVQLANVLAGKNIATVALVDNSILNLSMFNNQPVDSHSILFAPTFIGDANLDGVVDIKDLQDLANHWQQPVTDWSQADFNGDGIVDIRDLQDIANNWQAGVGAGGGSGGGGESFSDALALLPDFSASSPVPEPISLMLVALPASLLLTRRRGPGRMK